MVQSLKQLEVVMMRRMSTMMVMLVVGLLAGNAWAQNAASHYDTSRPLRDIIKEKKAPQFQPPRVIPNKWDARSAGSEGTDVVDPNVQTMMGPLNTITINQNFEGVSDDDNQTVIGFRVVPPDTQGDVGLNHYIQHVNLSAEIFDKSGNTLSGPFNGGDVWNGFGGDCDTQNAGDPITIYDAVNDRWIWSQFETTSPFGECIAVSTTGDPLGTYHRYRFDYGTGFPDYPKLGLWHNADGTSYLVMTDRNFLNLAFFQGMRVSVFEYEDMLNGAPASFVLASVPGGSTNDGWLPADHDGPTLAPTGSCPRIFGHDGANSVEIWTACVNSTFTTLTLTNEATLASTYDSSLNADNVVPPSPGEQLDILSFAAMQRLQYRNFGTHEMLLVNATVDAGGDLAGVKWWEFRRSGGPWSIHQEGTYAPADGLERWMGSIAMNGSSEICLGYSATSTTVMPSVRLTGQTSGGGGGVMDVTEVVAQAGTGVQQSSSERWGDYSAMQIDPSNDETCWFTTEYYANNGSFDFKTRIVSFDIDGGGGGGGSLDVVMTLTSSSTCAATGCTVTWTMDITNNTGASQDVSWFITIEAPTGQTLTSPTTVTTIADGATFTRNFSRTIQASRPAGTYTFTANASAGTFSGSDSFTVDKLLAPAAKGAPEVLVDNLESGDWAVGEGRIELPNAFSLKQNYPNPFNPGTQISFTVQQAGNVSIRVYNTLGQEVATLLDGFRDVGTHEVYFDASRLSAGVYLYVMQADGFTATRQMTLLK
jgi:hypothetical protein